MKVLLLDPRPFYRPRGEQIAIKRLAETFSRRGWHVDILTPREDINVEMPGIRVFRIPRIPWTRGARPGFSLKRAVRDLALFAKAVQLMWRGSYDLIHAVDESAFIGAFFWCAADCPFTYGMDSCLSEQMIDSRPGLKSLTPILQGLEGFVFRKAYAVLAACDAMGAYARAKGARHVMVLPDAPPCAPESFDRTALGFCDLAERLLLWDGYLCRYLDGVY